MRKFDVLCLKEIERPLQDEQVLNELDNYWELYIKIWIENQSFIAYCDIGSMISTMPKMVYDSLKYENMIDHPFYHPHADGSISNIMVKVKDLQVSIRNKVTPVDFMIMEQGNQGNIVLGRSFLKIVGCIINVTFGFISFYATIRGKFAFPN